MPAPEIAGYALTERDVARFHSRTHTAASDECWLWNGRPNASGYGRISLGGKAGGYQLAHRVAYAIAHGSIPEGAVICHECDTPACVNPAHLFPGTQRDNIRDASRKGRLATGEDHGLNRHPQCRQRGEGHWKASLSADDVRALRAEYEAGRDGTGPRVTQQELADRHGLTRRHMSDVLTVKRWGHL